MYKRQAATLGSIANTAIAADNPSLIIRVPLTTEKLANWSDSAPIYHPWINVGTHYECDAWNPNVNTVNYGQSFTQARNCLQDQERDIEIREKDSFSGVIKTVNTVQEQRTIQESESQNATGTYRNWVNHTSTFTAWEDFGSNYGHKAWTPAASTQTADFTQSRDFKHDQERFEQKREIDTVTGDIRDSGAPVRQTQSTDRDESRNVDVNVTSWSDVGGHYNCDAWSPLPETVDVYQSFTQTRECDQNQTRRWSYDASGSEIHARNGARTIQETESQAAVGTKRDWQPTSSTFTSWTDSGAHHTFGTWSPAPSAQTANFTQTRSVKQPQTRMEQKRELDAVSGEIRNVGAEIEHQRDIDETETRTVSVSYTGWTDTTRDSYSSWSPVANAQTSTFTQTRTYSQNQTRDRIYKADGATLKTVTETQTLTSRSESRTVTVSWSGWIDGGSHYDCGAWSPATNTIGYGVSFTQTRSCKQDQTRNRTYSASGSTVATKTETQTINENESQSATGVGSWTSHPSTFTAWSNSGAAKDHGSWSPVASSQTADFTQTRSYNQPQSRTEQKREIDTISGSIRNVGSPITHARNLASTESRLVDVTVSSWSDTTKSSYTAWSPAATTQTSTFTQSRSYTQNRERVWSYKASSTTIHSRTETSSVNNQTESRSVTVSFTGWSAVAGKARYACSTWSPATNTVGFGVSFTQTQSCKQDQERTRSYSIGGSFTEAKTITTNHSQSATGVGSWTAHTPSYSTWANSGSAHTFTAWSPTASTQTANFTQTQSYKQPQSRTKQNREIDTISGAVRNVGSPITENRDLDQSSSRSISVSVSSWANSSVSSLSSWSPAASTQTSNFTQTRSYTQNQARTWTYKFGSTTINTRSDSRSLTGQSESRNVTVSYSSWANSGSPYSCGSWGPSPSTVNLGQTFTQTRSCTQNQTRTRSYSVGGSYSESRTTTVTQSQSATGTKDYIVDSDYKEYYYVYGSWSAYGSWTPSASTQTSNFTQTGTRTREKDYYYKRYNVYKSGTKTLAATVKVSDGTESSSTTRTVTVSSSSSTSNINYGTWSPVASTVCSGTSFTQTRSYTQRTTTSYTFSIGGSHSKNSDSAKSQTQTASGTKTCESWGAASSTFTSWSTYSTSWSSYSPAATTQTSSFTQSRSSTLSQERYEQKREYDSINGVYRNVGSPIRHTRTEAGTSQPRTVTVSKSTAHYSYHSYSGYSPATNTVCSGTSFTQTESYKQRYQDTYSFNIGGSHYKYNDVNRTRTRTATGTKSCASTWSSGINVGGNTKNSGAPNTCFDAGMSAGYSGSERSGTCTVGSINKYMKLTAYWGNSCTVTYYKQTCG